jgi:hypothetical protein
MAKWTVTRTWRHVEAPTAGDALLVPARIGEHDSASATREQERVVVVDYDQGLYVRSKQDDDADEG